MTTKEIVLVRGDTLVFDVNISDIQGVTVESIYFSVKRNARDDEYVLQKSIGDGIILIEGTKYRVRIAPEDTWQLPARVYAYDLQIGLGSDIYTVLMGNFRILQDVTEETYES